MAVLGCFMRLFARIFIYKKASANNKYEGTNI